MIREGRATAHEAAAGKASLCPSGQCTLLGLYFWISPKPTLLYLGTKSFPYSPHVDIWIHLAPLTPVPTKECQEKQGPKQSPCHPDVWFSGYSEL